MDQFKLRLSFAKFSSKMCNVSTNSQAEARKSAMNASAILFASLAVAVIGLVRSKAMALLVGPEGVGLIGLLDQIMVLLASIAGLGLTFSVVKRAAAVNGILQDRYRVTGLLLSLGMASAAFGLFIFGADRVERLSGLNEYPFPSLWPLGFGIFFLVTANYIMSEYQALSLVRRLASVRLLGSAIGTAIGIAAIYFWRYDGIVIAVIAIPAGLFIAALLRRPAYNTKKSHALRKLAKFALPLASIGSVVMLSMVSGSFWKLGFRKVILDELSLTEAGLAQAALALAALSASLVLTAVSIEYVPRLARSFRKEHEIGEILEEQIEIALRLSTPILFGLIALAPIALHVLYKSNFVPAWPLLQILLLGEIVRLPGWAFAFVLLVRSKVRTFLALEIGFSILMLFLLVFLVKNAGMPGAGVAYASAYGLYSLALTLILSKEKIHISKRIFLKVISSACIALLIIALAHFNLTFSAIIGSLVAFLAVYSSWKYFWTLFNKVARPK